MKCDGCPIKNKQNPIVCGECMEGIPATNQPITQTVTVSAGEFKGERINTVVVAGHCPHCGSPIYK